MDNTPTSLPEFKGQDLKKRLLECLDREARQFSETARTYFNKELLSKDDKIGLLTAVITMVDHVMSAGDWNSSLFLRNTLKPLIAIKTEAQEELERYHVKLQETHHVTKPLLENEVEVYISLFQSDGYNINKWSMQLRSLSRYIIGRPVYALETDVQKRMRLRDVATASEAYVAVAVKQSDIQPADPFSPPLKDQFDLPLIVLKEVAIRHGRINAFVHQGMHYRFVDGQLIK